jgi:hypothetical protein
MSNRDQLKQGQDNRAPWENPVFRRMVTEDAEAIGFFHDEGNPNDPLCHNPGAGAHSCKNSP